MAELLSKTGTAAFSITYGSGGSPALPVSLWCNRQTGRVLADLMDSTGDSDLGRRWSTTDLVNGTVVVAGWMKANSGLAVHSTVVVQESTLGNNLVLAFGTASGTGGGGPGQTPTFKAVVGSFEWITSKTDGFVACMIGFRLGGVNP